MKILYYDCFAGISGDMNLGALVDLGVDFDWLVRSLKELNLEGYELKRSHQERRGIRGTKVDVVLDDRRGQNGRHHHHHERSLRDIKALIQASGLSDAVKKHSLDIFSIIARAEARIHGVAMEEVHFHELGAVDSIVDIVGAALCLDSLAVDRIMASPVEVGGGFVTCSHGTFPVPAPATLEILRHTPVTTGAVPLEMTTPTGAAILVSAVDTFTDRLPAFRPLRIGYGVGTRDTEIPNVLRVILGDADGVTATAGSGGEIALVECNMDDMNPEQYEYVMDLLFEAGALDVYLTPVLMKKSRPAVVLSVLCEIDRQADMEAIILLETTTLGVRKQRLERTTLNRDVIVAETDLGKVRVKRTFREGGRVTWKPEFEDCRRIARERVVPLRDVYDALERARIRTERDGHEE